MIAGYRVKERRIQLGLTQKELGNLLGVTKVSVCGYEKETKTPTLETFQKMIDILKLTPDELLNRDINIICDNEEIYGFKISLKEMKLIKELRKNKKEKENIYKKLNIDSM